MALPALKCGWPRPTWLKVIGKQGRTVRALRSLALCAGLRSIAALLDVVE